MERGHTEILGIRRPQRQRIAKLVQSTDQAWHWLWLFAAALITAG
jgi:hypothetical protein